MRLTDDRYASERSQFELALRMIRHEARTRTIRECTGLSDDRIRKLYSTYFRNSGAAALAPASPSPMAMAARRSLLRLVFSPLRSILPTELAETRRRACTADSSSGGRPQILRA